MPKRKAQPKQPAAHAAPPTKPLPGLATVPAADPVAVETPPPNPTQATLTRLLGGSEPADKHEAFLLFRWSRLTRLQRYALAFEWGLPFEKRENKKMAELAMKEFR